jgi:mono/diheme cytochrome c family protein
MPDQPTRQYLVSDVAVRRGFVLGGIGMLAVILALLVLITTRPQGRYQALDDGQHQALLAEAEARLGGFELLDDGAARLDIDHAMQLVVERGVDLAFAPAAPAADEPTVAAAVDGGALYNLHCMACHQASGAGVPGAFPPLADHIGDLYAADPAFPIHVTLYGLQGQIVVNGVTYNGLMPAFPHLSDAEIAALLNHTMLAWGDAEELGDAFVPYEADDVAAERGLEWTATDVLERRSELDLD